MSFDPAPDQTEYCLGLKYVDIRELTPPELAELAREAKGHTRRTCLSCLGCPLCFVIGLMVALAITEALEHNRLVGGNADALGLLGLIPAIWLLLRACDSWNARKASARAAEGGFVRRFAGTEAAFEKELLKPYPATLDCSGGVEIEVFPEGSRVWTVNGVRFGSDTVARPATVADVPEASRIAANWVGQYPSTDGIETPHAQRDLSPTEKAELIAFAKSLTGRFTIGALLFNAYAFGGLVVALTSRAHDDLWILHVFRIAAALWFDFMLARNMLLSSHLRNDERGGIAIVVCLQPLDGPEGQPPAASSVHEFLPYSMRNWSIDGRPAAWRKQMVAADKPGRR